MAKRVEVLSAVDAGMDVLVVRGTVEGVTRDVLDKEGNPTDRTEPVEIEARGWVSALDNHYDAKDYDTKTGQLKESARARVMTADERLAYCAQVLRDAAGEAPAVAVVDLGIAGSVKG